MFDTASDDNAPKLDGQLAAEAAAIDTTAPNPGAGEGSAAPANPAPVVDFDAEAAQLCDFAWATFNPLFPSLEPVWTEPKRKALASALAGVMRKYDVNLEALTKWAPELNLAIVLVPLIAPTIAAVRADLAAAKEVKEAPAT